MTGTTGQALGAEVGAYTSALTTIIGVMGTMADIEAKNEALMLNMANQAESQKYNQSVGEQQLDDLNRVLGDQLSASGLEAMKAESRIKAASAETGAVGTSNSEAIQSAKVNQLHQEAAIMRSYDVQKANKQQELVASRLNFENTLDSMISGQQSTLSAGLQTLNAGLSGNNVGLNLMGSASKEKYFNDDTLFGATNSNSRVDGEY